MKNDNTYGRSKKGVKNFIAGLLCGVVVMGGVTPVIAKTGKQMLEVVYNNIKVKVNGVEAVMPKGVEPFMYDGTTYLPVRAVAEALGEDVSFDKSTYTVYVGDKGTPISGGVRLSEYVKKVPPLEKSKKDVDFGNTSMYNNTNVNYAVNRSDKYQLDSCISFGDTSSNGRVDIHLKGNFKTLKGTFIPTEDDFISGYSRAVAYYGIYNKDALINGKMPAHDTVERKNVVLLSSTLHDDVIDIENNLGYAYTSHTGIMNMNDSKHILLGVPAQTTKPIEFEIDVTGVEQIRIMADGGIFNNMVLEPIK